MASRTGKPGSSRDGELTKKIKELGSELSAARTEVRRAESLFHALPVVVLLIQNGRIVRLNDAVKELLGSGPGEFMEKGFLSIIHPNSRAFMRDIHDRRLARKAVPEQHEADLKSRNGGPVPCEFTLADTLHKGKRAFLICFMPMVKRLEREKDRHQAKKMEALFTMASALAERFEKTCVSIQGQVRRLNSLAGGPAELLSREIRSLHGVVEEAVRTTAQLKTITRTEDLTRHVRAFNLGSLVKKAITAGLQEREAAARVRIKTYLRAGSSIRGRPDELQSVISHLVRNAAESMPDGGDLYVTSEEDQGWAHLYIMDNGPGIADRDVERLFDPCFTTRGDGAEGMGLSVAYAVVRRHGGEIGVKSGKGEGTEIHIRLPVAEGIMKNRSPENSSPPGPLVGLIMARDPVLDNLLSRFLSARGWETVSVDTPEEGLHRLKKSSFGCAVLESSMWPRDGSAWLCRKIKDLGKGIPVALIIEPGKVHPTKGNELVDLVLRKPLFLDTLHEDLTGILFI